MKRNNSKKSFGKFSARNTHKRKSKEHAKRELLKMLDGLGPVAEGAKIKLSDDGGKYARESSKLRRDEISAEGVFSSSKSGFGFVAVEGEERDVFIPDGKTRGAVDGDKVAIIYRKYTGFSGETKTEGRVVDIVSYGRKTLIGTVTKERSLGHRKGGIKFILVPDDPKITVYPELVSMEGIKPGDKIEAKILRKNSFKLECEPLVNFGKTESREANYNAILADCGIDVEFTREEEAEAAFFASLPVELGNRIDLRGEIIFTIDGEGAKDLDDAISLVCLRDGGYELGVHIADVSHYVTERSHLDRAVMARGTSVYFTDKVVPMLPKSLSNGACSLNVGEDKYALSAIIKLSAKGELIDAEVKPSLIRSAVRGVYSEVNAIFENRADEKLLEKYKTVIPSLEKMRSLYLILKDKSEKRGSVELDSPEAEILLDESGVPYDIIKRERGDAEKLIEAFMLAANEAVATKLFDAKIPCVYRVHEPPAPDKLDEFLNYAHNMGFDTSYISREKCSPADFSALLEAASRKELSLPLSYAMLRAMSKAKYSSERIDHFGLALEKYCHFTSPIRRLSDLATHRIIHKVLIEGKRAELYASYAKRAAAAASEAELRALAAERRIENLYKVIYMQSKIGEEFEATVSSVTSFGLFCMPDNTCEGLVPISELGWNFVFDEKNLTIRSRDTVYKLGDKVRVRLEEADIIRGKLRYSVV